MKHCYFCTNNIKAMDYKNTETLKKFVDSRGKLLGKKETNLCVKHQRKLAQAVKRARFLALLPFVE
ncbi:MAG: 30S ribosomal protein S18 [Candidatus Tagabacteria bacterium CG09_land_8_20_14_0_10_41_14]|uniref:30S ribosomal protein S18 n=2 Tax=Candidatus Tagaibacteriota TaxID=1817918 RepID=A0A2H0WLJ8_9BACT|nr:MAG: 30S ribosomal protein S18 [Candidatus Tagabacteria bacterium CG09_land_8_20_14_0_10_41_14]PJE73061.1 MAG: 30S ribosomal protein S18 [Candidatus Tagabacteria bacterium CG10_big_fil_rev_8_21_14_0_10_40_13]